MTGCSHSLATVGQRCPWCGQIATEAAVSAAGPVASGSDAGSAPPAAPGVAAATIVGAGDNLLLAPAPTLTNARTTDPEASHQAAAAHTGPFRGIHRDVLALLAEHGPLSDFDLAEHTRLKSVSVGKRRGELRDWGMVARAAGMGRSDTGATCHLWEITARGTAALRWAA